MYMGNVTKLCTSEINVYPQSIKVELSSKVEALIEEAQMKEKQIEEKDQKITEQAQKLEEVSCF